MLCTPVSPVEPNLFAGSRQEAPTDIHSAVGRVLAAAQGGQRPRERRRRQRTPYPYLIKLAPVSADGHTPLGEGIVVVGKHLSRGGIDFYHREPLPYRWTIAWLDSGQGSVQAMLVELLWCRFNKQGWYENGGRFVRVVDAA